MAKLDVPSILLNSVQQPSIGSFTYNASAPSNIATPASLFLGVVTEGVNALDSYLLSENKFEAFSRLSDIQSDFIRTKQKLDTSLSSMSEEARTQAYAANDAKLKQRTREVFAEYDHRVEIALRYETLKTNQSLMLGSNQSQLNMAQSFALAKSSNEAYSIVQSFKSVVDATQSQLRNVKTSITDDEITMTSKNIDEQYELAVSKINELLPPIESTHYLQSLMLDLAKAKDELATRVRSNLKQDQVASETSMLQNQQELVTNTFNDPDAPENVNKLAVQDVYSQVTNLFNAAHDASGEDTAVTDLGRTTAKDDYGINQLKFYINADQWGEASRWVALSKDYVTPATYDLMLAYLKDKQAKTGRITKFDEMVRNAPDGSTISKFYHVAQQIPSIPTNEQKAVEQDLNNGVMSVGQSIARAVLSMPPEVQDKIADSLHTATNKTGREILNLLFDAIAATNPTAEFSSDDLDKLKQLTNMLDPEQINSLLADVGFVKRSSSKITLNRNLEHMPWINQTYLVKQAFNAGLPLYEFLVNDQGFSPNDADKFITGYRENLNKLDTNTKEELYKGYIASLPGVKELLKEPVLWSQILGVQRNLKDVINNHPDDLDKEKEYTRKLMHDVIDALVPVFMNASDNELSALTDEDKTLELFKKYSNVRYSAPLY